MTEVVLILSEGSAVPAELVKGLEDARCEVVIITSGTPLDVQNLLTLGCRTLPDALPQLLESRVLYEDQVAQQAQARVRARQQSRYVQNAREQSFKARCRR